MKGQDRSWTEINLSNYEKNISEIKKFLPPKTGFMQIVKADAYGHGAYLIAKKALHCGASFLGVANVQEAVFLRYYKINSPILILSPAFENEIEQIVENDISVSVFSVKFAEILNNYGKEHAKKIRLHINIDTGMGRSGIYYRFALEKIEKILRMKYLLCEGIYTHFAASENDPDYSKLQVERFELLTNKIKHKFKYIHISNSCGVVNTKNIWANLSRIGLLSYGVYPNDALRKIIELHPVMTFKTRISQIKTAYTGDSIGYNRTYKADKTIQYAILPVGYADGYDYLLSNSGSVLIKDRYYPIIGKISMDMIAINITDSRDLKIGDEVILLGKSGVAAENLTALYNGSVYEILCQIGRRAKRYYFENGKMIDSSPLLRRDFVSWDYSDRKLNNIIEAAIEHRLHSKEISNIIYKDFLRHFYIEKDRDIHYRENFFHSIRFKESNKSYFLVETTLTFDKILENDYFLVVCAKSQELLEAYFPRKEVEYRWLLDDNSHLNQNPFEITSVQINNTVLGTKTKIMEKCIETSCSHPNLASLKGQKVRFSISTKTYYPKSSHQMTIYLTEMTKNVRINFYFSQTTLNVQAIPIFSGKNKFPTIKNEVGKISVFTKKDEWVFPNSGVVFAY